MTLTARSASHGALPAEPYKPLVVSAGEPRSLGLPPKYVQGRFLGKGGFAKCYKVRNSENDEVFAAKIVTKASINKPRALEKLRSEIAIHRSLRHDRVAQFFDYFEDPEYIYIILEMCSNQTLNELMRTRHSRRLSEPEAMFYLYELIVALKYLHGRLVLHRDLKLGNLFLDDQMRLKVGDFGLAAQLDHAGEKRKTICGTPNYIAPEILEGKRGHSFEVDIWSLGVVLYTMVFGRPPFETADVKSTYRRIRDNRYAFPDHIPASEQVKEVISGILKTDPQARFSLDNIVGSTWLRSGPSPPPMPVSILSLRSTGATPRASTPQPGSLQPPFNCSARSETPERGEANFARIDSPASRMRWRDASPGAVNAPYHSPSLALSRPGSTSNLHRAPASPFAQGAPSARLQGRPPVAGYRDVENISPNIQDAASARQAKTPKSPDLVAAWQGVLHPKSPQPLHAPRLRPPSREPSPLGLPGGRPLPARMMGYSSTTRSSASSPREEGGYPGAPLPFGSFAPSCGSAGSPADAALASSRGVARLSARLGPFADSPLGGLGFDAGAGRPPPVAPSARQRERCLSSPALEARGAEPLAQATPRLEARGAEPLAPATPTAGMASMIPVVMPELWVTKWVDYSNKYGVGYILSNGLIGVYFNDSTKIVLLPESSVFDYITRRTLEKPEVHSTHSLDVYPEELKKKVTLLKHFKNYMTHDNCEKKDAATVGESCLGPCPRHPPPVCRENGQVPFVKKWTQNKHATLFQLSNKIVQVVFYDRTEAILSSKSHTVTYFDKRGQVSSYPLSNVLEVPNPELAKRLRYIKDILVNLLGTRTEKA